MRSRVQEVDQEWEKQPDERGLEIGGLEERL
jgi:hypothetical protein